jgi:hypothetical protein
MKKFLILAIMVLTLLVPTSVMAAPPPVVTAVMTPSSSTIIKSVLVTAGDMDALVAAGLTSSFTITFTNSEVAPPYTDIYREVTGTDVNLQLWVNYGGTWFNINNPGWGASPFAVGNTTVNVYAISDHVYTYNMAMNLALISGGAYIATASEVINVMEATTLTADVVLDTILFSVNPTSLNFGTVVVGGVSGTQTFRITNLGTLPLKVTATVTGPLYISFMQLNYGSGFVTAQGATSGTITVPTAPGNNFVDVSARIYQPTASYIGSSIPGTLVFIASLP